MENLKSYVAKETIHIPILSDSSRRVIKSYEVFTPIKWDSFRIAIPSTYILDANHVIRYSYVGDSQYDRPAVEDLFTVINTLSTSDVEAAETNEQLPVFVQTMKESMNFENISTDKVLYYIASNVSRITDLQLAFAHNVKQLEHVQATYGDTYETLNGYRQQLVNTSDSFREIKQMNDLLRANVQETQERLKDLMATATAVNEVNRVISNIAERTKILALNASIEAARAGEHGKGFAVVAQEVTKLATGTGESAKSISDQLKHVASKIEACLSSFASTEQVMASANERVTVTAKQIIEISQGIVQTSEDSQQLIPTIESLKTSQQAAQENLGVISENERSIHEEVSGIREDMDNNMELLLEIEKRSQESGQ